MSTKSQINALTAQALNHPQLKLIKITFFMILAIVYSRPLYSQSVPEAPFNLAASPNAVCASSPYTYLKAVSPGNSIRWYTVSTGGTSIGTTASGGSLYVNVTQPTSYFAESVTPAHVKSMTRTVVTVGVNTAPVITYMPADVNTNNTPGQCGTIVTYPSASAMGTPTPNIIYSDASGSNFESGSTTVIVSAVNVCGTSSLSFDVTVNDIETPTIVAPTNISIVAPQGASSIPQPFLGLATASDNCGILAIYNNAPAVFLAGNTNVTWTTIDYNNNITHSTQVINVRLNNLAPDISRTSISNSGNAAALNQAYKGAAYTNENTALQASVFPNPFTSDLTINLNSNSSDKVEVTIYDPLGKQIVNTQQAEPNMAFTINNHLSPGMYYVHITQGAHTKVMKVVKR